MLYRQRLDGNAAFAAQLELPVPDADAARPADWPEPKPFALAPGTYRLPPEVREVVRAQLDVLQGSGGLIAGLDGGQSATAPKEYPRRELAQPAVYQLKLTLRYSDPEVWRRVRVPNDLTLGELHRVIQIAMGWDNAHPGHAELSEWMGRDFDPEAFNLEAVNRRLASLTRPRTGARRGKHRRK